MTGFFWNFLLALAWTAMTGELTGPNFILGFVLGYCVLVVVQGQLPVLEGYAQRLPRLFMFLLFFIRELVKANFKVAFDILTPPWHMQPGVIGIPLQARSDLEITLVANIISLTPGTLSLDVSDDKKVLFIHAMFLQDEKELRQDLDEIQRRVLEVIR